MKRFSLILILVITALFTLTACSAADTPAATTAEPNVIPAAIIAEGRLLPVNWLEQSFNIPGTVASVQVQDGDLVTNGQPLASLEPAPDAALALARAEQEFLAAQQALDNLNASAALALAQGQLKVLNAQEALEDAQADYDVDDSAENKALLDIATAALVLAEDELTRLEEGAGVDSQLLQPAQARLDSANAALSSAQSLVAAQQLKANLDGVVVGFALQPGQKIAAGTPLFAIADPAGWVVKTDNLSETQVASVAPGDAVTVVVDALPELKLTGVVTHINARYEEKRGDTTYTVTIAVNEIDPAMRWGMTAAVYFQP